MRRWLFSCKINVRRKASLYHRTPVCIRLRRHLCCINDSKTAIPCPPPPPRLNDRQPIVLGPSVKPPVDLFAHLVLVYIRYRIIFAVHILLVSHSHITLNRDGPAVAWCFTNTWCLDFYDDLHFSLYKEKSTSTAYRAFLFWRALIGLVHKCSFWSRKWFQQSASKVEVQSPYTVLSNNGRMPDTLSRVIMSTLKFCPYQ